MESTTRNTKSQARRSLPVPTTRTSLGQRPFYSSPSVPSISPNPEVIRPNSSIESTTGPQRPRLSISSRSALARPSSVSSHSAASSTSSIGRPYSKPNVQRSTDSVASSSITLLPVPSRTRDPHRPSTSSTATTPRTAYGFLTPANAANRSSAINEESPTTPKGPRQRHQAELIYNAPPKTPSKKVASPYMNTHVADPCISGCLVHQLSPCGHKVMAAKPDPCASNCRRPPSQQAVSAFTNILQSTEAFVCAACVEVSVQSHREMKRALFSGQMDRTELQMGGFPPGWREEQSEYWERVWENDVQAERAQFEKLGRKCFYIPGQPIQGGEAREAPRFSSVASPWPPSKRPLASKRDKRDGKTVPAGATQEKG